MISTLPPAFSTAFTARLGSAGNSEAYFGFQLTLGEQTNTVFAATRQACCFQRSMINHALGGQFLGVDEFLHHAQIDLGIVLAKWIVEAALRDTHMKRHLAAFKALNGNARTALLALLTATAGFALARANTPANAHTAMAGTFIIFNIV